MKRCAVCGQENDDWRPFCANCGASYAGSAAEPVVTPPPPGAPPAPMAPPPPGFPGAEPGLTNAGRPRRPRPVIVAIAAVLAVVVGVGAFIGLSAGSSKHRAASTTTTTFPATWDPRVISLVQFDAAQRKLDYEHPVKVLFLSAAAFKKRVTTDDSKLTAKDKRDMENALAELRAMGMVQGNVDLFAKANQLSGATTEAFYDFTKKEVVIPGSTLDVAQRVTLAHELTHTLDDEHFDLTKVEKIGDNHDTDAVTALVEGDAVWVENKYIAKLSPDDRRAYERSQDTALGPDDLKGVPKVFEILQEWPYDFGPIFVDILQKEGGESRVNQAFKAPPIDEEQVIDPVAYLYDDKPGPISLPTLPKGAKKLDSGKEFGALFWYLMLSERIDAHVALKATIGWGADSYIDAREGTKTCVEVHYRGETLHDNAEMLGALHQWIAALPRGTASVTKNSDNTLSLHSCDPGAGAKVVTNRSVAAYGLLLFRDQLIDEFIQQGAEPDLATCASDAVTAQATVAGVNAGQAPPVLNNPTAFAQIIQTCRATSGTVVAHDEIDN